MSKKVSTLDNLTSYFKNDFGNDESEKFEKLEKDIIEQIKNNKSICGTKLETIAKIEEYKNRQLISGFALLISLVGIELSLIFNAYERGSAGFVINFVLASICVVVLVVHVIIAINQHVKNYKFISYYTVKLHCIEKFEKEQDKNIGDDVEVRQIKTNKKYKSIKVKKHHHHADVLQTMEICIQEYIHRDNHMWSQIYKFFLATLLVILLPNLTDFIGITIPDELKDKYWIFPICGILMSFVFLYNSISLIRRFQAVSKTYNKLIRQLPENLQREKLENIVSFDKLKTIWSKIHTYLIPSIMFIVLIVIGIFFYKLYLNY